VRKLLLRLFLSLLIGAGMLYLAARKIDWSGTWSALSDARWWVLVPYFATMAIQHLFRAWRWKFLLAPIHPVPFSRILPVATVGFAAIIALPLRMGELVRPYLIADPPHVRMSHGLGTMAVERVVDGLILALGCFAVVMLARARGAPVPGWLLGAGLVAAAVFLAALTVLVMALWQRRRAVELCRRLFGFFSPRLGDRLAGVAEGIVDGFAALPSLRSMALFLAGTIAYWALNGVVVWIMGLGFGMELGLGASTAMMVIVGVGIMIPAGPGFIGNFEFFASGALDLYAPREAVLRRGAGFILALHAANAAWYLVTGALALLSPQISFTRFWQGVDSTKKLDTSDPSPNNRER
jgi:uncharacterized protein (TIRG00374 family)